MIKRFIESLREERDGFSFDEPWRLEEKGLGVIIPIKRKSKRERDYITLAEAGNIKVEDTGQIDYVFVRNEEKKPVLVSRGEIFRGKTQERASIHDHIIQPGKGLRVAVRCVHQSKGIAGGTTMEYGGRTPYEINLSSQRDTWGDIANYTNEFYVASSGAHDRIEWSAETNEMFVHSSDDLSGTISDVAESVKEIMKKIPFIKNQVGAAFFHENKMKGLDVYDIEKSWDSVKKEVVEKEGASFIKKDAETEMFEYKPEKAHELLKKCLSEDFEEKEIYHRDYKVVELRSKGLLGEVVEFKGNIIHLTLYERKEGK